MLIIVLVVGVCLGSFINALVWRVYQQALPAKRRVASKADLSITKGRSICTNCQHQLAWYDLIPVASWLTLGGKCRYCHKKIGWQYPLIELLTAALFGLSYLYWPMQLGSTLSYLQFVLWLLALVLMVALAVYDLRWQLLPNRLVLPLTVVAFVAAGLQLVASSASVASQLLSLVMAVVCLPGLFYLLFQLSKGKWIGGGDVKVAVSLALLVASPTRALLVLFVASLLGTLASLPGLASKKLKQSSRIPFGPYLIVGTIVVVLFGVELVAWYERRFLTF